MYVDDSCERSCNESTADHCAVAFGIQLPPEIRHTITHTHTHTHTEIRTIGGSTQRWHEASLAPSPEIWHVRVTMLRCCRCRTKSQKSGHFPRNGANTMILCLSVSLSLSRNCFWRNLLEEIPCIFGEQARPRACVTFEPL